MGNATDDKSGAKPPKMVPGKLYVVTDEIGTVIGTGRIGTDIPNAAEPQPKRSSARTPTAPRFTAIDVIPSSVHPALKAQLSRPLVHFSGCFGCRHSA